MTYCCRHFNKENGWLLYVQQILRNRFKGSKPGTLMAGLLLLCKYFSGLMMVKSPYYIVNGITIYRLLAAPLLIFLVFYNRPEIFKWLLPISFFTDMIDGFLARKFKVSSVLGAKLDSIADDCTIIAAMVGMIVFKKEFLHQHLTEFAILFSFFLIQILLAFIRYGKMSSFHTYAAKFAALLQGLFMIFLFLLPEPVYFLFYPAIFVTAFELIEEIILVLLVPEWQVNLRGLYWVLKKK